MNAAVMTYRPHEDDSPFAGMKAPLITSVSLHALIFLLGLVTLPFLAPSPLVMPQAVTVEMVDISEIAQTDFMAPPNKPDEASEELPEKAPDPVYNSEEAPPVLETPKEPEIAEVPPPPVEKPQPPQEQVAMPEDVKPAPIPKTKPKPPPKPAEQAQEKPKDKPEKPTPQRDLSSVLKDITPDAKKDRTLDQILSESTSKSSKPSQIAPLGSAITASEIDAIKRGIQPCWVVDAGAQNAQNMQVSLRVYVGPDLVVTRVDILDTMRYAGDPIFKSFAESARRALTNPRCSKLNIPPDKYEQFKVFKATFDPRGMI
ncbi:MAG: cell envelope integrity protein TolA [Rhodospirillales bacterium]|nr:cell envelope integrity protein TolA [Alphaproteobacteria bacterium]MCB9977387.1 cell envelope integrity protein TolA [Rhodospirillales bacterium]